MGIATGRRRIRRARSARLLPPLGLPAPGPGGEDPPAASQDDAPQLRRPARSSRLASPRSMSTADQSPTPAGVGATRTAKPRRVRWPGRALLLMAASALLFEALAAAFCVLVLGTGYREALDQRRRFLASLPGAMQAAATDLEAGAPHRRFVEMAARQRRELHPFFGYTLYRDADGANNHGFPTRHPYPYVKQPNEYVIGIFGGSVAQQVVQHPETLRGRLTPALRQAGYQSPTLLPFAMGGWRQPQSTFALLYYLDSLDLVIFLDGFNEVVHLAPDELAQHPARFPFAEVYTPLIAAGDSPYAAAAAGRLELATGAMARATRISDRLPLRYSLGAHLIWRAIAARYTRDANVIRAEIERLSAQDWRGIEAPLGDAAARATDYLRFYSRLTREAAQAAAHSGKPFFHFVQPNQYVRGSKPLSDIERDEYTAKPWAEVVTPAYARLEQTATELRASGIHSTYLGRLFEHTGETVYSDDCCHLNPFGLALLEEAMADEVLASGLLPGRSPPAREPASQAQERRVMADPTPLRSPPDSSAVPAVAAGVRH